jgi:hypothetical protein
VTPLNFAVDTGRQWNKGKGHGQPDSKVYNLCVSQHYRTTSRTFRLGGLFDFFFGLLDFPQRSGKLVREVREIAALPDPGPGPLKRPVIGH